MITDNISKRNFYLDIHCHPTLRPYNRSMDGKNSPDWTKKTSVWHYQPPDSLEKMAEMALGVAFYSQSNFQACLRGNLLTCVNSIYPPEIGFFENKLGTDKLSIEFEGFITEYGEKRIAAIENNSYEYFNDLQEHYNFLLQLNGCVFDYNHEKYRYIIVNSFDNLISELSVPEINTITIIVSIEGGHSFGGGKDPVNRPADKEDLLFNVQNVRKWKSPPFYVTLAHHFYNELCGHACSFPKNVTGILNQSFGMDTGFTPNGIEVLNSLLEKKNGRRVLIDIKHMSVASRKTFYQIIEDEYKNEKIPIIYSHGGVNGFKNSEVQHKETDYSPFNRGTISLFDDEIIRIAASGGIIGLNMDERVMSSKSELEKAKSCLAPEKRNFYFSKIIWNNIRHIAEVLDSEGLPAWDFICIGSDYDGFINPISGFWTEEELPKFSTFIAKHAEEYFITHKMKYIYNNIEPKEIVQKIFQLNNLKFLKNNLV